VRRPGGAHDHQLALGGELVVDEQHRDEHGDRQHHLQEARQHQHGEIKEQPERQAAIDDEVDEPQRLHQPHGDAERDRDEQHQEAGLAQHVAGKPVHGARV